MRHYKELVRLAVAASGFFGVKEVFPTEIEGMAFVGVFGFVVFAATILVARGLFLAIQPCAGAVLRPALIVCFFAIVVTGIVYQHTRDQMVFEYDGDLHVAGVRLTRDLEDAISTKERAENITISRSNHVELIKRSWGDEDDNFARVWPVEAVARSKWILIDRYLAFVVSIALLISMIIELLPETSKPRAEDREEEVGFEPNDSEQA